MTARGENAPPSASRPEGSKPPFGSPAERSRPVSSGGLSRRTLPAALRRDRRRRLRSAALLAALTPAVAPGDALSQFRVETRAVLVDVSAFRGSEPVEDLSRDDFALFAAGAPVEFRLVDRDSLALAVLFAMDVSASTAGDRRRRLAEGATLFASSLGERDSCGVVAISMAARWLRPFGPCGPEVGRRLRRTAAGGPTALRDGILLSLAALRGGSGRGVLLAFTDGDDNLSWAGEPEVLRSMQAAEALVYAVIAPPHRASRSVDSDDRGREFLRRLSEESGGRTVEVRDDRNLTAAFREILDELRVRYVLAFTPPPEHRGFVPLRVEVERRGVRVRARSGYTAR